MKWSRCVRKLGKFQFAGDNGVVDTIRDEADEKHLFQIRKFAQLDLHEVLTLQSSLSAKAAVGASMICLQSMGNSHLVLFESDEQGGDQYASQDMLVQNQLVCFRAQTTITTDYSFQVLS